MEKFYGVSAAHPIAVDIGMKILEQGGNAVDAAIGISFALGVVEPYASGIGGGGNMLIYPANNSPPVVYDYREVAPMNMNNELNIGVPGFLKGMEEISQDYGNLPFQQLILPSIDVAENGFQINHVLSHQLRTTQHKSITTMKNFYPFGEPLKEGEVLIQPELAESMKKIASQGIDYFYNGSLGRDISSRNIGLNERNLLNYEVKVRNPLQSRYGPYTIWTAPAPAGGGTLIQALHLLEKLELDKKDVSSPEFIIGLSKILRKGYELRLRTNGDPDFIPCDEVSYIKEDYIQQMALDVKMENIFLHENITEFNNTTHFSVIDKNGMMVSTTNTLSNLFGSGVNANGIFLNDQMRNFKDCSTSPNKLEEGKRCQSLIAPTIISKDNKAFMTIGSSGGERITTMIVRTIVQYLKQNISLQTAVDKKRFYVQGKNVYAEENLSSPEQSKITDSGYRYRHYPTSMFYGGVHALAINDHLIEGAADPRRGGTWVSGG